MNSLLQLALYLHSLRAIVELGAKTRIKHLPHGTPHHPPHQFTHQKMPSPRNVGLIATLLLNARH